MTKIRITGFENITPRIKAKIARSISQSGFPQELQNDIIREIRDNGIEPGLASSTIKTRRYLQNYNSTDAAFSPEKSNLTLTGQLLNALRAKFVGSKLVFVVDSLTKKHSRYKTATNKGKSPLASLKDIFVWQAQAGRDIAQVFTRPDFVDKIASKLKDAILKNYRN